MSLVRRIVAEKRVALVAVTGLLLADILLYGGAVYPLQSGVVSARARAGIAASDLATQEAARSLARGRLEVKNHADAELQQFYEHVLPQGLAGARSITYPRLAALAGRMGLVLERRTSDRDQDDDSGLGRLRTTMLLRGEYGSIRRFIEALETAPDFLVIEEIVLSQREALDDSSLVLTLGVSTYYRSGDGV